MKKPCPQITCNHLFLKDQHPDFEGKSGCLHYLKKRAEACKPMAMSPSCNGIRHLSGHVICNGLLEFLHHLSGKLLIPVFLFGNTASLQPRIGENENAAFSRFDPDVDHFTLVVGNGLARF